VKTYDADTVKEFVEMDVATRLAEMNDTSELS
jgi:hypothetical protein